MECLQLLPGQETPPLCQFVALLGDLLAWGEANAPLVMAVLGGLALFFALWSNGSVEPPPNLRWRKRPKNALKSCYVTACRYSNISTSSILVILKFPVGFTPTATTVFPVSVDASRFMRSPIAISARNIANWANFVSLPVNQCRMLTWC